MTATQVGWTPGQKGWKGLLLIDPRARDGGDENLDETPGVNGQHQARRHESQHGETSVGIDVGEEEHNEPGHNRRSRARAVARTNRGVKPDRHNAEEEAK